MTAEGVALPEARAAVGARVGAAGADVTLAARTGPARRTLTHEGAAARDHVTRAAILTGILPAPPNVLLTARPAEAVWAGADVGSGRRAAARRTRLAQTTVQARFVGAG